MNNQDPQDITVPVIKRVFKVANELLWTNDKVFELSRRIHILEKRLKDSQDTNKLLKSFVENKSINCPHSHQCPVREVIKK